MLLLGGGVLAANFMLLQGEPDEEGEVIWVEQMGNWIVRGPNGVGVGKAERKGGEKGGVKEERIVSTTGLGFEQVKERVIKRVASAWFHARLPDFVAVIVDGGVLAFGGGSGGGGVGE